MIATSKRDRGGPGSTGGIAARGALPFAIILLAGLVLRIGWLAVGGVQRLPGEAPNVARAVARTGTFGDPFFVGQGATAHLMPTTPLIAGLIQRLFGIDTPAALAVLAAWSLAQVFAGFVLLLLVFRAAGTRRDGLLLGMAVIALVPIFLGAETVLFAYWESALAVVFGLATLLLLIRLDGLARIGWPAIAGTTALAALTFFTNGPLGLGIYTAAAIFYVRNIRGIRLLVVPVLAFLMLAALIAPWVMRNAQVMGAPVLLRDNAGLELAIANHPGALAPADPLQAYKARIRSIHPLLSSDARQAMVQAGGEVRYARQLGAQTKSWIAEHPFAFARLAARHVRQFYLPSLWQFRYTGSGKALYFRLSALNVLSFLGLCGIVARLARRSRPYAYIGAVVIVTGLCYAPFQPMPRYIYLIFGMLVFAGADLVTRLSSGWSARRSAPNQRQADPVWQARGELVENHR